jgi:hypothetical protein
VEIYTSEFFEECFSEYAVLKSVSAKLISLLISKNFGLAGVTVMEAVTDGSITIECATIKITEI